MRQKYSSHLRQADKERKTERWRSSDVKQHRERKKSWFKWKQRTGLHQICSQRDSHRGEEWRPIPVRCAAPQEIAGAVSLTGVWLYIPSLCWPQASPLTETGNIETIVHRKVVWGVEGWGGWRKKKEHAGIEGCLGLNTDSQHTRQKRFTQPLKRETVTCSRQGKPTLVFIDIFL